MSPPGSEAQRQDQGVGLRGQQETWELSVGQRVGSEPQQGEEGTRDREPKNQMEQASTVKGRTSNKCLIFMVLGLQMTMAKDHN